MTEKYFWKPLGKQNYTDWSSLCDFDSYRYYSEGEKESIIPYLSGGISSEYFKNVKEIMVLCSGERRSSCTYFVMNFHRKDKGNVIDEDPLIVYFKSGQQSTPSGMILFHGDWAGRTSPTPIPKSVIDDIEQNTIKAYFPSSGTYIDIPPSGSLSSLEGFSDIKAFNRVISKFRENMEE